METGKFFHQKRIKLLAIDVTVLTISDRSSRGERDDLSGPALCQAVHQLGWNLVSYSVLPDDFSAIQNFLLAQSQSGKVNLILTTGGTGFSPRDVTPEATLSVVEKRTPGLVEKIRIESSVKNPNAILSRAEAGICKKALILNLPGSPNGAVESFLIVASVLPHALSVLKGSSESETSHEGH